MTPPVLAGLLLLVGGFALGAWRGAPYLPILRRDAQALLDLADLSPGQTLVDLGSGDGRFLRAAARRGIRGIGYEINPWLYLVSRIVLWRYRRLAKVYLKDFWTVPLPQADAVYVFLIGRYMERLDEKLARELGRPTPVVSYIFALPGRRPEKALINAYRYRIGG